MFSIRVVKSLGNQHGASKAAMREEIKYAGARFNQGIWRRGGIKRNGLVGKLFSVHDAVCRTSDRSVRF